MKVLSCFLVKGQGCCFLIQKSDLLLAGKNLQYKKTFGTLEVGAI